MGILCGAWYCNTSVITGTWAQTEWHSYIGLYTELKRSLPRAYSSNAYTHTRSDKPYGFTRATESHEITNFLPYTQTGTHRSRHSPIPASVLCCAVLCLYPCVHVCVCIWSWIFVTAVAVRLFLLQPVCELVVVWFATMCKSRLSLIDILR